MFDAYLWFPCGSVKGETKDKTMSANFAFELASFSLGAENTLNIGSSTGGAGAGKASFKEFSISKSTDTGSTGLFHRLVTGKHFEEAKVALRRSGGSDTESGVTFMEFNMLLVAVKDISWSGSSGDDIPTEEVLMEYGAIEIKYYPQDKTGAMGEPEETMWSRVLNEMNYAVE